MLEHIDFTDLAKRLRQALSCTLVDDNVRTPDHGGTASTSDFTQAIVARLS